MGLVTGGVARADVDHGEQDSSASAASSSPDPALEAVNPVGVVSGSGVKVGESSSIYPILGVESGYVSNVFYVNDNPTAAAILRVLGEIGFGSLSVRRLTDETGTSPLFQTSSDQAFQYRADLYGAWNQYLSSSTEVRDQSGFAGGAVLRLAANANHPINLTLLDHFARVIRPTNFESSANVDRDINTLQLRLQFQPAGRNINGYVYYDHLLDLFEDETQQFADRFNHTFGARFQYQWLPLTQIYVDGSIGVFGGIGSSSEKVSSYPLTMYAGAMTALTLNTTLNARVGYQNGFYSSGPSYSSVVAGVELGYRYSPFGRMRALYSYEYQDSINANFYHDHVFQVTFEHQVKPLWLFARPEVRLREYEGLLPQIMSNMAVRNDVILAALVGVSYNFRNWLAASLEYQLAVDQTDFRYMTTGSPLTNPSYIRNEVMLGIRAAR
jgi:hypothetical protein